MSAHHVAEIRPPLAVAAPTHLITFERPSPDPKMQHTARAVALTVNQNHGCG